MANRIKDNEEEMIDLDFIESQGSYIKTNRQDIFYHQVSLDKPIGEPSQYRDLINLLYMADENAEFNIFINSPGGGLSAAMAIIEGIKASNAKVRAILTGEVHSAASIIALNCQEIVVTDSAHMLVHNASYGVGGTAGNIKSHVDFSHKMIDKLLISTYSGFLTPTELLDVKKGVEYWFDSDEIGERLVSRKKFMDKKVLSKKSIKTEIVQ